MNIEYMIIAGSLYIQWRHTPLCFRILSSEAATKLTARIRARVEAGVGCVYPTTTGWQYYKEKP